MPREPNNPYVNSINYIYNCSDIIGYNRELEKAKLYKDSK